MKELSAACLRSTYAKQESELRREGSLKVETYIHIAFDTHGHYRSKAYQTIKSSLDTTGRFILLRLTFLLHVFLTTK